MGAEKYKKAVDELVRLIRSGTYSQKGLLPGEYELAGKLGVARETARKAIAELINRGLVERKRGVGTYPLPSHSPNLMNRNAG